MKRRRIPGSQPISRDMADRLTELIGYPPVNPIIGEDMDDEDDSHTCPFCGDMMFNEDGLWICSACGCDVDPDEEEEDWG